MAAIGIDLGTTFSCVSAVVNGKVEIIPNRRGNYITPSCVAFTKDGRVLIGEDAKAYLSEDPSNTIFNVKRVIGLRKDDPTFKAEAANLPYKITEWNGETAIEICIDGVKKYYYPEDISAKILSEMKAIAKDFLGEEVVSAVITVPARFNSDQKRKTREAAKLAGLHLLNLIHEPTAAAIAYGMQDKTRQDGRHVLVYDLGGGTFDVNILTMVEDEFKISASSGNTHLGGEDFDEAMVAECIKEFAETNGIDLGKDPIAKYRIRKECEKTKIALSSVQEDNVIVEKIADEKIFRKEFTRAKFEFMNDDKFSATMESVGSALKDAKLDKDQIGDIVLVGGSTRIPHVQKMLQEYFNKPLTTSLDCDQSVAYGAALHAAVLSGNVSNQIRKFTVRDVIPLSLGIRTRGDVMSVVVKRNTQYPTYKTGSYTTVIDNQTSIKLEVHEGERPNATLNHFLGSFVLDGIPAKLAGEAKVRVFFNIDNDGLLHVSAIDQLSGNENGIKINWKEQSLNLECAETEVQRAGRNKEEDEKWKKRVLAANNLEYKAKKLINSTTIPPEKKLNANTVAVRILDWLKESPCSTIDEIETQLQKLHEYSQFM